MLNISKRTTAVLSAAFSLGIAAPAGAMPFNADPNGSMVPVQVAPPRVQRVASTVRRVPPNGGDISDLGYIGIATGGLAVVLLGAGGIRTVSHRRRHPGEPHLSAGRVTP